MTARVSGLLHRLQHARVGAVVSVARLDFRCQRGRVWTHEWTLGAELAGLRLQLVPTRVLGEPAVVFRSTALLRTMSQRTRQSVHREVLLSPYGGTLHAAVRAAHRFLRMASTDREECVLAKATSELYDTDGDPVVIGDAPARVGLQWAVREGADPGWLQRAWEACERPMTMGALLKSLPGVPACDVPRTHSTFGKRFPNRMLQEWFSWAKPRLIVCSIPVNKLGAAAIRRAVPRLPTVAEMLAAQTTRGDAS